MEVFWLAIICISVGLGALGGIITGFNVRYLLTKVSDLEERIKKLEQ